MFEEDDGSHRFLWAKVDEERLEIYVSLSVQECQTWLVQDFGREESQL